MKKKLFLLSVLFLLACCLALPALAYGSYGIDFSSPAYQDPDINPYVGLGYNGSPEDGSGGECTWFVFGRAYEKLGVSLTFSGNATNWTANAAAAGYETGTEARANAIMVEHYSTYGHVFFVEKVENGYAYVTEANYKINGAGCYHEDVIDLSAMTRGSTSAAMNPVDYVYLQGPVPESAVAIDGTNFPDEAFRRYVRETFDPEGRGYLDEEQIAAADGLSPASLGISSLKGIELFPNLTYLDCSDNGLTALDVSANTALETLICSGNRLTALNLNRNTKLRSVFCSGNELTSLNAGGSSRLTRLDCSGNRLTALDVSRLSALETLVCASNRLTDLDVSANMKLRALSCGDNLLTGMDLFRMEALEYLVCSHNSMTSLDLTGVSSLVTLQCYDNQLTGLNLSSCPALETLSCGKNQLTALNVTWNGELRSLECDGNRLTYLNVNSNPGLENLACSRNGLKDLYVNGCGALRSLTCYGNELASLDLNGCPGLLSAFCGTKESSDWDGIAVDTYTDGTNVLVVDRTTALLTDALGIALIPDNFPDAAFLAHLKAGCDSDGNGYLSDEEIAEIRSLSLDGAGIVSLQGIGYLTALEELSCAGNRLQELDVSGNPALTRLDCHSNQLRSLTLYAPALRSLDCWGNGLSELLIVACPYLNDAFGGERTAQTSGGTRYWLYTDGTNRLAVDTDTEVLLAIRFTVSGRKGLAKPTMGELRRRYASVPALTEMYETAPVTDGEGYRPGVMSSSAYANALGSLNYFRTAAGLDEVAFTDELNLSASYGALCLAMLNRGLNHYPSRPDGMSQEDYERAYAATGSSNLAMTTYDTDGVIKLYMGDEDISNVDRVGHRRWILDPYTLTMGIGAANRNSWCYSALRVMGDGVGTHAVDDWDFVAWPASGNNLTEAFDTDFPWSVSLNGDVFAEPSSGSVRVTLTRVSDGRVWTFDSGTDSGTVDGAHDFFNVETTGYGHADCIIFRPAYGELPAYSGEYTVEITGLTDVQGNPASIRYSVLFDTADPQPAFKSQSLVLSGQIGLNFFLELPEIPGVDYTKSYMTFTIGKDTTEYRDDFDPNHMNSGKTRYGFTCYVNSIQMADTIRAVFHYGNGKTVSKDYSVSQYVDFFEKNIDAFNAKTIALIRAIADFGHYEQIYLADVNHWTVGDKYAEMKTHYTDSFNYDSILSSVNGKAFVKTLGNSDVEKATYKLHLDSETTVDVYLTPKSGKTLTASATFNGKTYTAVKQPDGRYLVRIPNISAHQLGDMITVTGTAGTAFSVQVSALSYTRSVLNNAGSNQAAKDGLSALYQYYTAVLAYRS